MFRAVLDVEIAVFDGHGTGVRADAVLSRSALQDERGIPHLQLAADKAFIAGDSVAVHFGESVTPDRMVRDDSSVLERDVQRTIGDR